MKRFTSSRKFLFGVSVSMVLAMAIGSFALGEGQAQASPMAVETQNSVGVTVGQFTVNGGTQGTNFDYTSPVLTIHSGNLTVSTTAQTSERIVVDGAATITLAGVNINTSTDSPLKIQDDAAFDVNILLADGSTNILGTTNNHYAGLQKNGSGDNVGTLTIGVPYGSAGTGKLQAKGGYQAAGIGSGGNVTGSNITISGGEVTANGGYEGAGIGGGDEASGSNITISGGEVIAIGGDNGAGIGGGSAGSGSNITISGGKVTATSSAVGTGIGGGNNGSGSNIIIRGGVVVAIGKESSSGIGGGQYGSGSNITISGGLVTANGGQWGAGIGGGFTGSGSDIKIDGGLVTANGGQWGAGIGGGSTGSGSDITISGGEVTAYGGKDGAGIGGGSTGSGSDITITGGVVRAYGGQGNAAGIGGVDNGSGRDNSLNGDAVVLAVSGDASKAALEGFDSLFVQGIAFTGLGTAFDSNGHSTEFSWDESGTMYGNVTLSQNLDIPANLTVSAGQILSIKEGKDVTLSEEDGVKYTVEGELRNNGIVTLPADLEFNDEGKVTTAIIYDTQDGTITNADEYKTYQDSSEVKTYSELPNAEKEGYLLEGWYTEKNGEGTKVEETSLVLLNQHILYANWAANPESIPDQSVDPGVKTGDSFAGIAALAILGVATTGVVMLRKRK